MNEILRTGFQERLKTAADAKKALLAAFKPKVSSTAASDVPSRAEARAADLARVRQDRIDAKAARQQAAAEAVEAARMSDEAVAAAALDAKRGERKERKALSAAEAKAKRDAKYAARKAR